LPPKNALRLEKTWKPHPGEERIKKERRKEEEKMHGRFGTCKNKEKRLLVV